MHPHRLKFQIQTEGETHSVISDPNPLSTGMLPMMFYFLDIKMWQILLCFVYSSRVKQLAKCSKKIVVCWLFKGEKKPFNFIGNFFFFETRALYLVLDSLWKFLYKPSWFKLKETHVPLPPESWQLKVCATTYLALSNIFIKAENKAEDRIPQVQF